MWQCLNFKVCPIHRRVCQLQSFSSCKVPYALISKVVLSFRTITRFLCPYTVLFTIKPLIHYNFSSGTSRRRRPVLFSAVVTQSRSVHQLSSNLVKFSSREATQSIPAHEKSSSRSVSRKTIHTHTEFLTLFYRFF